MEIVKKSIYDIKPYINNPRNNDEAVGPVAESIKAFGFKVPIVIDKDGVIVTGHTRLKAAEMLGLQEVPCIVADDLTPEQVDAFRLADNKVAEFATWNQEMLELELSALNIDMSVFGFDTGDLEDDLDSIVEDEAPGIPEEPRTKRGEIWQLGEHRLMCGDSTKAADVKALMNGQEVRQELEWVKNVMVLGRQDYQWKHEPCLYGWKDGAAHYFIEDRTQTTVIEDLNEADINSMKKDELKEYIKKLLADREQTTVLHEDKPSRSELHPTMKPLKLMARQIRNSTRPGELVLDLFGGSGSTMMAAEQLGRRCCTMEFDPKYCDVIIDRWELFTGKEAERIKAVD